MTNKSPIDKFVDKLNNWYKTYYKGFKTIFDKTIANVQTIPEGQDPSVTYDWKNSGEYGKGFRDNEGSVSVSIDVKPKKTK